MREGCCSSAGAGVGDTLPRRFRTSSNADWIIGIRLSSKVLVIDELIIDWTVSSCWRLNPLSMCRGVWVSVSVSDSWCPAGPASSGTGETVGWRSGAFPLDAAEAFGAIALMILMILVILVVLVILVILANRLAQLRGRLGLLDRL